MTDHYTRLAQLKVEHAYFRSGVVEEVRVRPSEETRRALRDAALQVRTIGPVWLLVAEVDMLEPSPGADPEPHLVRPLSTDVLRLGLVLESPVVPHVADIDDWQPGRTVHYLSNLTSGGSGDAPYLTDHVASERLGPPITLVTRPSWTYPLSAPAAEVDLTITDLFGNSVFAHTVVFEAPVNGVPLHLASVPGLTAGRYTVSDGDGGSEAIYYAPGLDGEPLFAMIELYVSSVAYTGPPDQVGGGYRFLDGDVVTEVDPFVVEIPVRTTHWEYVLEKKYPDNGIDLDRVDVAGDLSFSKTSSTSQSATFESGAAVAWAEEPPTVTLEDHRGRTIRRLPVPGPGTVTRDRSAGGQSAVHVIYL